MGDMADWINEQGEDDWHDHVHGTCGYDGPCQYCEEEEAAREKRRRYRLKLAKVRRNKPAK